MVIKYNSKSSHAFSLLTFKHNLHFWPQVKDSIRVAHIPGSSLNSLKSLDRKYRTHDSHFPMYT